MWTLRLIDTTDGGTFNRRIADTEDERVKARRILHGFKAGFCP